MAEARVRDYQTPPRAWLEVDGERVENARFAKISFDNKVLRAVVVIEQGRGSESKRKPKRDVRSEVQREPGPAAERADSGRDNLSESESEGRA